MLSFAILAILLIAGSVGVISLRQPVHAALSLVATLMTLAVVYISLEAHFLAAIQVIVYAGAIMVLFLFVIMLLNVADREDAKFAWMKPAAYIVGALTAIGLVANILQNPMPALNSESINNILNGGSAEAVADVLFNQFVLAFQLVGVLLLTGIVGATSLVQHKALAVKHEEELANG